MRSTSYALAAVAAVGLFSAFAAPARADEVIEIYDHMPAVKPLPLDWHPRRLPAYSDKAVLDDAWTRAWVLLDIDATGKVTRFKFLHKPGYDLEELAAKEVWKLSFSPARDGNNRATDVRVIWSIEWPSQSWLLEETGVASYWPADVGLPPTPRVAYIPCKGEGPSARGLEKLGHGRFNMGGSKHYSVDYSRQRDCSRPDVSHVDDLPWIDRPANR